MGCGAGPAVRPIPAGREQLYLCFGMGAALAMHVSFARPTFAPYYVLAVPLFAVLAAAGLYEAGSAIGRPAPAGLVRARAQRRWYAGCSPSGSTKKRATTSSGAIWKPSPGRWKR